MERKGAESGEEEAPSTPHSASPASSANLSDPRQNRSPGDELPSVTHSQTPSPLLELDGGLDLCGGDDLCPYCHKSFRQPRLLHCLHALCEDCIIALLEGQAPKKESHGSLGGSLSSALGGSLGLGEALEELEEPEKKSAPPPGVIRCPVCAQDSQIGNDVRFVGMLLVDWVRVNLMDAEAVRSSDTRCQSCKSREAAEARCQDCAAFLCVNCVQAHQFMRCFEGHTVVPFAELRASESAVLAHRPVPCPAHAQGHLAAYCRTCDAPVCKECLVSDHAGPHHTPYRIDQELTDALRSQMRQLAQAGEEKADHVGKLSGELEGGLGDLKDRVEVARELVDEAFGRYASLLDEKRQWLQKELERLGDVHEDHVTQTSKALSTTAERLHDACQFAQRLADHGSAAELLLSRKAVVRHVQNLVHQAPPPSAPTNLHFVSDPALFAKAVDSYAGTFKSDLIQPGFGGPSTAVSDPWKSDINQVLRKVSQPPATSSFGDPNAFPYPASNPPPLHQPQPQPSFPKQPQQGGQNMEALAQALAMMSGSGQRQPPSVAAPQPGPPPGFPSGPTASFFRPASTYVPSAVGAPPASSGRPADLLLATSTGPLGQAPSSSMGFSPFADSGTLFGSSGGLLGALSGSGSGSGKPSDPSPPLPQAATSAASAPGSKPSSARNSAAPTPQPLGIGGAKSSFPPSGPGRVNPMQVRNKFGALGPAQSQFNSPHGFCLGPDEEIVVADTNNHRIQVFLKDGTFKFQFGAPGKEEGQLWYPRKVAVVRQPQPRFVVCDRGKERSRCQVFNANGQFLARLDIAFVDIVAGLAVEAATGEVVVVDSVSPTLFRLSGETGELLRWFSLAQWMKEPSDVAVAGGEHFVCDFKGHSVCVFAQDGTFARRIGSEAITSFPNGIDISNQGDVLIGDSHGNKFHISVFKKDGEFQSEFDCPYVKVSRCCGLRITQEGFLVTLAKNNHHVLVLNTLYLP